MKRKLFLSALLCTVLVLTLLPVTAGAGSESEDFTFDVSKAVINISTGTDAGTLKVAYGLVVEKDNIPAESEITIIGSTEDYRIRLSSNVEANITLSNVNIKDSTGGCAFYIDDNNIVNLTLDGDNFLTSDEDNAGLRLVYGAKLTIGGNGSLTANGGIWEGTAISGAGIGGGYTNDGGTIIINSGTITANGGGWSAGIGGGGPKDYGYGSGGGNITINGGTVTANGGDYGAGMGGGGVFDGDFWQERGGYSGNITINGGTVTARGSNNGAGIGGGGSINTDFGSANITISGGTVTASNGDYGVGIGGIGSISSSAVMISGGIVFAQGATDSMDICAANNQLGISGTSVVFLQNKEHSESTNITAHILSNFFKHTAGDSVCGIPVPWSGDFSAYLPVTALSALSISEGTLNPAFTCVNTDYTASVAYDVSTIIVKRTAVAKYSTTKVNDGLPNIGTLIDVVSLNVGVNTIKIVVTAQDHSTQTYTITVTREDAPAPTIVNMTVLDVDGTYTAGESLGFNANFSDSVIVSGTPRIPLTVGSTIRYADYESGSGTDSLVFRYSVQSGDYDSDGITLSSPIDLNGGTIQSTADTDAILSFESPVTSGILVGNPPIASYSVTLNQDTGGTATASHTSATAGTPITLGISSLDTNYSFVQWNVSPSVTWTSGSETSQNATFTMPDGNVTVTPVYHYNDPGPSSYSVTLNQDTGGTAMVSDTSATAGTSITLGISSLDTNYSFVQWDVSPSVTWTSGSATSQNAVFTMPDGDVTVTPIYQYDDPDPSSYSVTLNQDRGGTATVSHTSATAGTPITLGISSLGTNYRFVRWDVSPSVTWTGGSETSKNVIFTMPDGDVTVTPIYRHRNPGSSSSRVSVTNYTITATAGAGGSISPGGSGSIATGSDKIYTITADNGYETADVLADGVSVGAVSSYTFKNVTKAHTIAASFQKVNPFSDVSSGDWFYDNVLFVYREGLMHGTGSGLFGPKETMTRGMVVTVLFRMSGDAGSYTNPFDDVAPGAYYENTAAWAYANGIVSGTGGNQFSPDSAVTREQFATMLYRYAKYKGYDISVGWDTNILSYNDAFTVSAYAYPALQWACGAGVLEGDTGGNLNPQSSATRAETAAILERFMENTVR